VFGLSEADWSIFLTGVIVASYLLFSKLLSVVRARGRRVIVRVDEQTVIDVRGMGDDQVSHLVRNLRGEDRTVVRMQKATAEDVRQ
jgi:malonyl CoA-acyl carrier protein transacylase